MPRRSSSPLGLSLALALALVLACGDDGQNLPGTDAGSSTALPGSSTADVTDSVGTSSDPDTGTAADTTSSTGDATTSDATTGDATTGAADCDLLNFACEAAELGGPFMNCGIVHPETDPLENWQAAHDCAVAAAGEGQPFKLVTWLEGIDSTVGYAYVGLAGESYAISRYWYDSYPPELIEQTPCGDLNAEMDCVVAPGNACLSCDAPGAATLVCGGER